MISLRKLNFPRTIAITKKFSFSSTKNFMRIFNPFSRNMFYIQKRLFCNLARLNFEKMSINKPKNTKNSEDQEFKLIKDEEDLKLREAEKAFVVEENIVEFSPSLNWDEVVMKSEIPVLVDCYAE